MSEATWHRVSATMFGADQWPGTVSGFFDYDLKNWMMGFRFDIDPAWYGLTIGIGPVAVSFDYWRPNP